MREIKFRGYCDGKMFTWEWMRHNFISSIFHNPHWALMQFTGLKDKNGNEIYEGDIVKIDGGGEPALTPVDFEAGCFVVRGKWIACHTDSPELKYYVGMPFCTIEVIGNIYEHPHLLGSK